LAAGKPYRGIIARYQDRLAIRTSAGIVTLLEGDTPLVPAPRLADKIAPGARLYLKCEGTNPTGSFKDRGMTAAVTDALASGSRAIVCASTGNTAASAAAYAARAGIRCVVVVPSGKIALGKLAGALAYGAQVIQVQGGFDEALRSVRELCSRAPITLVNSLNPARIEGQKTAAFEIVEALGTAPDWLALPVGNAGNITSYWKGFRESVACGDCPAPPRILGAQAAGAAPIVLGQPVPNPETVATAIRIGNPARWQEAEEAIRDSHGHILAVSDEEILAAYRMVARTEGVFCEPASAASLAGLAQAVKNGVLESPGRVIVCVLTGHGLKDPDTAIGGAVDAPTVRPNAEAILEAMERRA
jgi:threonine synthase